MRNASLGVLEFGTLAPDLPDIAGQHMETARNVIPRLRGYDPLPQLVAYSDALPSSARALGAASFKAADGAAYNVVGTATNIYLASSGSWNDISRATPAYSTAARWEFVQWKQRALAASLANDLQTWTLGAANATDLVSSIKASSIAVVRGNQVLVGDVNDADGHTPNRLRWCAVGDADDWTPSVSTLAGFTQLESTTGGRILRVVGGEFALVFLDRSIWRATFTGDSAQAYQIDEIEQGIRTIAAGGVLQHAGAVWYLSEDGFRVTRGGQSEPFGEERIDREVLTDFDADFPEGISATVLQDEQTIVFAYPGAGNSGGVANKLALYNINARKWALGEEAVHVLTQARRPFTTLEDLDALYAELEDVPGSLDDPVWTGGGLQSGAIDANGKAAFFTGSDRTAVFETAEVQHTQGGSTYVDTVRPVVEGADLDLEVGSRANQSDAVTFKPPTQPNSVGECEVRTDARYLRYRVTVRAPWSTAFGVEPHGRPSGSR